MANISVVGDCTNMAYEADREPEQDYIQLTKYFHENIISTSEREHAFHSNIWQLFPKLDKIEIEQCTEVKEVVTRHYYTKSAYDIYKCNRTI